MATDFLEALSQLHIALPVAFAIAMATFSLAEVEDGD